MPPAGTRARLLNKRTATRKRGLERKASLVHLRGGGCSLCGYDRSIRALHFHHVDPADKTHVTGGTRFRSTFLAERKWPPTEDDFWDEFWSCELICANCHMETEERKKHGQTDWKAHIDPAIHAGFHTEQRGVEGVKEGNETLTDGTTTEVTNG